MQIILKHDVNPVKGGFAARSAKLGLVAHGRSPDVARRNLERVVLLYLRPFERQGTLERELELMELRTEDDGAELTVVAVD